MLVIPHGFVLDKCVCVAAGPSSVPAANRHSSSYVGGSGGRMQYPGMAGMPQVYGSGFTFRKRFERIDWKRLGNIVFLSNHVHKGATYSSSCISGNTTNVLASLYQTVHLICRLVHRSVCGVIQYKIIAVAANRTLL